MATSFKKTVIKSYPRIGEKITEDSLYWKHLEFPITRKGFGAVTCIDFSPVEPHHYAVTSSTKVEIFSARNNQVLKTFTKFKQQAFSGTFRGDGKLLVAGGEEGFVRLFDVSRKALLRTFKEHTRPVHVTRFTSDNLHILSGGDDKVVNLLDVPSQEKIASFKEHQDYIRTASVSKSSKDIFITGSYDHTVKLFDARTEESSMTLTHGHPVECVLMHPNGSLCYSAGGDVIKVWDLLGGGRLLASFSNHHKTVTSLTFCSNYTRLVSAGLDRNVKIYDTGTFEVVHTLDYVSAILSVGISPNDRLISVGMSDGYLVSQKRRDASEVEQQKLEEKTQKKKASYKFTLHSKVWQPDKEDHVIEHKRKEQLTKYDKYFKHFQYSKALDAAMDVRVRSMHPETTISILQELIRRGGIKAALVGRDEKSLAGIIRFLQKNLSNAKYMNTVMDVTNMVIDLYKDEIGQSTKLSGPLKVFKDTLVQEMRYQKEMMDVKGILDTILAASLNTESQTGDLNQLDMDYNSKPDDLSVHSGESSGTDEEMDTEGSDSEQDSSNSS